MGGGEQHQVIGIDEGVFFAHDFGVPDNGISQGIRRGSMRCVPALQGIVQPRIRFTTIPDSCTDSGWKTMTSGGLY
jgi:hypothetical protein